MRLVEHVYADETPGVPRELWGHVIRRVQCARLLGPLSPEEEEAVFRLGGERALLAWFQDGERCPAAE